jgi:N,N'-diacetyllegionaminate synthase
MKINFKKKERHIIAEAGVNHNGNKSFIKKLIQKAKLVGSDSIKFQTFLADTLSTKLTPKAHYQKLNSLNKKESHYEMLKKLELSRESHYFAMKLCKLYKINFLSTAYDEESARFLIDDCKIKNIKVASADIIDLKLHEYLAKKNISVIISTGMSNIKEIDECYKIYKNFNKKFFAFMHCVSNYPCKNSSLNLNVIEVLKKRYKCEIGFSDHSNNNVAAIISSTLGVNLFEKHFTLDRNLPGPDHKASYDVNEFRDYVNDIKLTKISLGNKIKKCQEEEKDMKSVSRKSIVAKYDIKKKELFSDKNITFKRPGTGISPMKYKKILGRKSSKNYKKDELIIL